VSTDAATGQLADVPAPRRQYGSRALIARTAAFNSTAAGVAALSGIILARSVGATVRGEYAAVTTWYGAALIIGGLGQPAALCYFAARDPQRARDYVTTARAIMLATGGITLVVGVALAPLLAHGEPGVAGAYRIVFIGSAASYVGASFTFALQATDMKRWNLVLASQPVLALAGMITLSVLRRLTLQSALFLIMGTLAIQVGYAYYQSRRSGLVGGRFRRDLLRPLIRYGLKQFCAVAPATVNTYLDQLVLSQLVPAADLGRYAIAVSITLLPGPLVGAIGNVAFPRLAARRTVSARDRRQHLAAIAVAAAVSAAILVPIAVSSYVLIPDIAGPAYRSAIGLLWLLTPGGIFLACGMVAGDLLRGLGRPDLVAVAQGLAAVCTVILLFWLIPVMGVAGAALASSISYSISLSVMIRWLWRPPDPRRARHRRGPARAAAYQEGDQ
jgi:O-antigen/teichoic acid export membrane protein